MNASRAGPARPFILSALRPPERRHRPALDVVRRAVVALAGLLLSMGTAPAASRTLEEVFGEAPQGFGRATTGGCLSEQDSGCLCRVTTLRDDADARTPGTLRFCASERGPRWIVFDARGALHLERPVKIASDKIIDGRPRKPGDGPVTISGASRLLFLIADARNIVLTDLVFRPDARAPDSCRNPRIPRDTVGCGTPILIRGDARNIWINHGDFRQCGNKCVAIWTSRPSDAGEKAAGGDLVTISNSAFKDSYFGILIGAGADLDEDELPDRMRVTLYGNLFDNVFRRSPRAASYAQVHAFNNVIRNWGREGRSCFASGRDLAFGASSNGGAELLLENNVFAARPEPQSCKGAGQVSEKDLADGSSRGSGRLRAKGNLLLNGAVLQESESDKVFDPGDVARPETAYPYRLRSTHGLQEIVERSAGVRGFGPAAP